MLPVGLLASTDIHPTDNLKASPPLAQRRGGQAEEGVPGAAATVKVHSSSLQWQRVTHTPPPHIDMYIIQSYPEQHNTLKKIYSYIQYL